MKRVLFVLGAFAAMSLVGCDGKQDCACGLVERGTGQTIVASPDYLDSAVANEGVLEGSLNIMEFDGECTDATWTDLSATGQVWKGAAEIGELDLKCKEM
ncbi:MAG: hypothetical protein WC135_04790 [Bacteroidales bacterium]